MLPWKMCIAVVAVWSALGPSGQGGQMQPRTATATHGSGQPLVSRRGPASSQIGSVRACDCGASQGYGRHSANCGRQSVEADYGATHGWGGRWGGRWDPSQPRD